MTPSHGPQFDQFTGQAGTPHGGAQHDEFHDRSGQVPHGGLEHDSFDRRPGVDRYGARWDEFGWSYMPPRHGGLAFDSDFTQPAALDGSDGHGTWHDVFRGAKQVRYVCDGRDCEGVVENTQADHAVVRSRDGRRHEVALSQIVSWRSPVHPSREGVKTAQGVQTTETAPPASSAQAPSAHDQTASGGHLRKTTDAAETAVQGQPSAGTVGRRANCPLQGNTRCGAAVNGKCSQCGVNVSQAAHKTTGLDDVLKTLRELNG